MDVQDYIYKRRMIVGTSASLFGILRIAV
ncbi:Protein of unknown function [Bacillus mycoides]|uniref:Uncharacterized protein n=1 Tax=Bacillus mycoides TaxID=1405 RepID=A0A1G4ERA0_BACMY|nr:Protein of unknown function [Bacillus mycoides]